TRSVVLAVNPKDERSPAVAAVRKLIPRVAQTLIERKHWSATVPDRV
ncbi:LysR family transcriptional regulator, partial [Mesorhizobium sp. VK22E]|nr:LysR family transcriptional regulator [Mesorhizobium sp. VK22E]